MKYKGWIQNCKTRTHLVGFHVREVQANLNVVSVKPSSKCWIRTLNSGLWMHTETGCCVIISQARCNVAATPERQHLYDYLVSKGSRWRNLRTVPLDCGDGGWLHNTRGSTLLSVTTLWHLWNRWVWMTSTGGINIFITALTRHQLCVGKRKHSTWHRENCSLRLRFWSFELAGRC